MKRLIIYFLLLGCFAAGAPAAGLRIYTFINITNTPAQSNAMTLNADSRMWRTNVLDTTKQMQITNAIGFHRTNLYLHLSQYAFTNNVGVLYGTNTNDVILVGPVNQPMNASISGTWGYLTFKTNPVYAAETFASPTNGIGPTTATNHGTAIAQVLPLSTFPVPEFILALSNYLSLSATQTVLAKTLLSGSLSNMTAQYLTVPGSNHIDFEPNSGFFNWISGGGLRFGSWGTSPKVYTVLSPDGEEAFISMYWVTNGGSYAVADFSPFVSAGSPYLLNVATAVKLFPILDGSILELGYPQATNNWQSINVWSNALNQFLLSTRFSGGINVSGPVSTITNANGAFVGLTATNFNGLGGYLSNFFGNALTLSNAPVIHVLNLQAGGGYASNLFANYFVISNATSINGVIGLITGGSWSNATVNGLSSSNSVFGGTNIVTGDISFPWYNLNTIGAGNNPAIPIGTNTFIDLSGNGGPATIIGIAGGRKGREILLYNASAYAITLAQNTLDPVAANRLKANIAGDWAYQPGEWVRLVWKDVDALWHFVIPTAAGTNFITSGRNDTNLVVRPSSSNNVPLTVIGTLNQNTNLQIWQDGNSNTVASINATGTLSTASSNIISAPSGAKNGYVVTSDANGVGQYRDTAAEPWFGDGLDGAATFDGAATPSGTTLVAANTYRLDRDVYYTSVTISAGVTVKTGNHAGSATWRLFCNGTLTNSGTIFCAGTDGGNAVGPNTAGAAGTAPGAGSLGGATAPGAGRAGPTGVGTTGGGASPAADPSDGGTSGAGGAGGNGVSGGGGNGAIASYSQKRHAYMTPDFSTWVGTTNALLRGGNAGGGGASGGGNGTGTGGASGGGGGGGGILFVWARYIGNSGTITANGGNGGNGISPTVAGAGAQGGGAGGGGGGGGVVYMLYHTLINSGTITANGGTFGTGAAGVTGGTGGGNGVGGSNGEVLKFNALLGVFE